MNWVTIVTTLLAATLPSVVSIVSARHQSIINEQNNELQLSLNKQNNDMQEKMYRLEYYYSKQDLYVNTYLEALTNYLNIPSEENLLKYKSSLAKVYMYVSSTTSARIEEIDDSLNKKDFSEVKELLSEGFCNELAKEFLKKK